MDMRERALDERLGGRRSVFAASGQRLRRLPLRLRLAREA